MTVEERIRGALHSADTYQPSPDLFAKVKRSIEEDRAVRTRRLRISAVAAVWLVVLIVWLAVTARFGGDDPGIPWWSIEVAINYVLVTFLVTMGPLIRRFGQGYAGSVFLANPETGNSFLRLIDVAYYLIMSSYILIALQLQPVSAPLGEMVNVALAKIGGMFLLAGIVHGTTIVVLPAVGLVFSSTWRRSRRAKLGPAAPPADPAAEHADRVVRVAVWVLIGIAGVLLGLFVLGLAVGVVSAGLEG